MTIGNLALISLDSGKEFARRTCEELNKIYSSEQKDDQLALTPSDEVHFSNGEVKVMINNSLRDKDVYIFQLIEDPHSPKSINDNIMALSTAIDACFYCDAKRITAVIPQYPYARQDKKRGREGITAKVVGKMFENTGADRVITLDIHSEAIEGFFNKLKIENLHCGRYFVQYIKNNLNVNNLTIVAPDVGSAKRGLYYSSKLETNLAIIEKVRDYHKVSTIDTMRLVGDVKGRDVFINDDMLATGGTLLSACRLLKDQGARDIYITVSLPFFNKQAYIKFDKAYKNGLFKQVIGTDAVMWGDYFLKSYPWYKEISVAPLFAQVISSLNMEKSVSKLLE